MRFNFSKRTLFVCLIITLGIVLDQIIKIIVFSSLSSGENVSVIGGFFSIERVYNTGASFGMLSGKIVFFVIFSFAMLGVLTFFYIINKDKSKLFMWAYSLIVAGAVGNLIDRIVLGKVRDMIYFHFFPAVFNVADSLISIGTALLVIYIMFYYKTDKEKKKDA